MPEWKVKYPGVENLKIAVMGCIVNGPGESKQANIGISLPGDNEDPSAPVFVDGKKFRTLKGKNIENEFIDILQGLENGIRSGLSYSGARNLNELKENAEFVRQTQSGLAESNTHIKWRYDV